MKEEKPKQLYFSHDYNPRGDRKLLKLFMAAGAEGYGIYWLIVEFMHQNEVFIDDEELLAYDFRVDVQKIHSIMNDFGLFRIENNRYISDRILKNIEEMSSKSNKSRSNAQCRWLLSAFSKYYEEFFNEKPVLNSDEIEVLKKYSIQIPDFKDKLRDILYTLKGLKFKDLPDFKPKANWLLKGNNLARLINGEFGGLKHFKTQEEIETEKNVRKEESRISGVERDELKNKINAVKDKTAALNLIKEFYKGKTVAVIRNKAVLLPDFKVLTEKFRISDAEILKLLNKAPPTVRN